MEKSMSTLDKLFPKTTLHDVCKTKKDHDFLKLIVKQIHSDPIIKRELGCDNDKTEADTIKRILKK